MPNTTDEQRKTVAVLNLYALGKFAFQRQEGFRDPWGRGGLGFFHMKTANGELIVVIAVVADGLHQCVVTDRGEKVDAENPLAQNITVRVRFGGQSAEDRIVAAFVSGE